jgi:uncharacterized protein
MRPDRLDHLIEHAERLLTRLEAVLPSAPSAPDFGAANAFRWRKAANAGYLQPVRAVHAIRLDDLQGIAEQKERLVANTRQFIAGRPANNALLTGARGSGKSSIVKALFNEFVGQGLRLIEVDKSDLIDLPDIVDLLEGRPERYIIFCDDLSFDAGDASYKALKVVLDGSLAAAPDNVLIYATSNRRHLMPRDMIENERSTAINPAEAVEEKMSLSDRFGLWLGFHGCDQDTYFAMIEGYARHFGLDLPADELRAEANEWSVTRGARSGRVAWQFIQDLAGRMGKSLG